MITMRSSMVRQRALAFRSLQMHSVNVLLVALAGCGAFAERYLPIKVSERWAGTMKAEDAGKLQASVFLIQDSATWHRVFQAWSDGETPEIDFERESIVVVRGQGPNNLFLEEISKNRRRDLRVSTSTTLLAGPRDCYLFLRIPKTDVESINGVPISELAEDDGRQPK